MSQLGVQHRFILSQDQVPHNAYITIFHSSLGSFHERLTTYIEPGNDPITGLLWFWDGSKP